MEIWLLITVLVGLTLANYWRSRSVLYPPFLFSAIWLLVIVVYQAGFIVINPLHSTVLILVAAGAVSFTVGGEFAQLIPTRLVGRRLNVLGGENIPPQRKMYFWKFLMLLVAIFGMVHISSGTISAGLSGGAGSILANAREAGLSNSGGDIGIGGVLSAYISLWANCTLLMFFIERRDRWFWVMFVVALITAIATTGRGPVLEIFATLITAHLIQTKRLGFRAAFRFARTPILIFLSLYLGLTFTNKDTSTLEGGLMGVVIYFFVGYMIGPLAAMDYVLQHPAEYAGDPNHTFKLPLKLGDTLHLWSYTPPPLLGQFVEVPFPTNVYTGYKFYLTDFGFIGCLIVIVVIGFVQTFLYRKALMASTLALYLFCFLTFCLVMFVFDDLYSAAGQVLCVVFFGVLYQSGRRLRLVPRKMLQPVKFSFFPNKIKLTI